LSAGVEIGGFQTKGKKKQRSRQKEGERSSWKHESSSRTNKTQTILFFSVGCWKSGKRLSCAVIVAFFVCINMIYYTNLGFRV